MGILEGLAASKWLLTILAAVLGAGFIFYKGYSTGSDVQKGREQDAINQINEDVRSAEATNQTIEEKKSADLQQIGGTSGIDKLISLWRSLRK